MKMGSLDHKAESEDPRQRILNQIENLERQAQKIQRDASAGHHWNNNSIFRHQSRVQPVDVSRWINRLNDEIRGLKAQLAEMGDGE